MTEDLGSKTSERALVALPRLRIKFVLSYGFSTRLLNRGDPGKFFVDSNNHYFLFFSFSLIDKDVTSSSSATTDAATVAAAKGKQPAAEASQFPAAEDSKKIFKADRCHGP